MRKQLLDLIGSVRQHILEISIRVMSVETRRLDQAHDRCRYPAFKAVIQGLGRGRILASSST